MWQAYTFVWKHGSQRHFCMWWWREQAPTIKHCPNTNGKRTKTKRSWVALVCAPGTSNTVRIKKTVFFNISLFKLFLTLLQNDLLQYRQEMGLGLWVFLWKLFWISLKVIEIWSYISFFPKKPRLGGFSKVTVHHFLTNSDVGGFLNGFWLFPQLFIYHIYPINLELHFVLHPYSGRWATVPRTLCFFFFFCFFLILVTVGMKLLEIIL